MNTNQFEEYKRPVTPSVVENLPPSPNRNSFQWRNPSESNGEMINGVESRQRRLDVLNWSPSRITKKRAKEAQKQNLTATTSSKFIIDGDFDFDRPPSRQRSESLIRRQQELFNAMNMDFNDNDKQQEEDQNFDLELPFDVQGSDVNNNNNNNDIHVNNDDNEIRSNTISDDNTHFTIRNFATSPNEFLSTLDDDKLSSGVGLNNDKDDNKQMVKENQHMGKQSPSNNHFIIRNFATSPNEFTSAINIISSGGFDKIDMDDDGIDTISLEMNLNDENNDSSDNNTTAVEKPIGMFKSPPRKLTRSLSEEKIIVTPNRKPSPYKSGSFALISPARRIDIDKVHGENETAISNNNDDTVNDKNISAKNPSPYKRGTFIINRKSRNDDESDYSIIHNNDDEDTNSQISSTIDGQSGTSSVGGSPTLSANSFTSLHTAHGYNSLNNSLTLNRSILEIDESNSESDGGDEMIQKLRYGEFSSDDEEETNLIKSIINNNSNNNYNNNNNKKLVNNKINNNSNNTNHFRQTLFNTKNRNLSHQLNKDIMDDNNVHQIPKNAKNLPLLEQQSHESHDVLIHTNTSMSTTTQNAKHISSSASSAHLNEKIEVVLENNKSLPGSKLLSTDGNNGSSSNGNTMNNNNNYTNQHIDENNIYFYFDSTKVLDDIPDSSENLVEWQNCVTVTGKTRHQRVFPELKNGVEVTINGEKIALFRHLNSVYAMTTQCPHRKGPIQMGDIEDLNEHGPCVVCPWHRWTFKLNTGRLVKPENRSHGEKNNLKVFPVQLKGIEKKIFIGFPKFSNKIFEEDGEEF